MLHYLSETDSTNTWVKQHLNQLQDGDGVYTQNQTAGRGRLGRQWKNMPGCGLYYTVLLRRPMKDPAALPLYASLAAAGAIRQLTGIMPQIKWPNDLLINGKKVTGILCESVGENYLCGIGINLAHPQSYFQQNDLPHGTSLLLAGADAAQPARLAKQLAEYMQQLFSPAQTKAFCEQGFVPFCEMYNQQCINLGKQVFFEGGNGVAERVDEHGHLLVRTERGNLQVFTGEVSIQGIYGC